MSRWKRKFLKVTRGDLAIVFDECYRRSKFSGNTILMQRKKSAEPIVLRKKRARFSKNRRKGRISPYKPLNPYYVIGFIDGEGCFSVSFGRHKTLKRKTEIRAEFSIELRADDKGILERIRQTIGCGKIYNCDYERYGWHPHVKYKIGSIKEIESCLIPFLDRYPLQAKKKEVYQRFRKVIKIMGRKGHLEDGGFKEIQRLRSEMRLFGKKHRRETARVRENRSPSGVRQG